jgi:pSer/pThr/pTyr-binding forkhead associated (FHA) protein
MYSIEVWRDGVREAVVPIMKPEISIGRGSRSVSVDLPIKGDPEVSRVHAVLSRDNEGRYWLVAKGRNATMVNGRELQREEATEVAPDQKISICNFVLRIQPK